MKGSWSEFYSSGFFGYGLEGDYKPFGLDFFIPVILTIIAILLVKKYSSFFKKWKYEEKFRICFVTFMVFIEMSFFWRLFYVGPGNDTVHTMITYLPLQVCQWTLLVSSFMMLTKSRRLFPTTFYLCNTGNFIAMLMAKTVITTSGPTYYRYYQFWLEHALPIIGNYYMMYVYDFDIKFKEIYKPLLLLIILSIPSIYMDAKFDICNYMYFKLNFNTFKVDPSISFNGIILRFLIYGAIMLVLFALVYAVYNILHNCKGKTKVTNN